MNILHIEHSNRNSIIYTLLGFFFAGILLFINYDSTSKSSVLLFIFYVLGLSLQIGYWFFKKPSSTNFVKS